MRLTEFSGPSAFGRRRCDRDAEHQPRPCAERIIVFNSHAAGNEERKGCGGHRHPDEELLRAALLIAP